MSQVLLQAATQIVGDSKDKALQAKLKELHELI